MAMAVQGAHSALHHLLDHVTHGRLRAALIDNQTGQEVVDSPGQLGSIEIDVVGREGNIVSDNDGG